MKTSNLNKIIAAGLAFAGLALTPNLRAAISVFLEGGSASQSVLYDRATNLFAGGRFHGDRHRLFNRAPISRHEPESDPVGVWHHHA